MEFIKRISHSLNFATGAGSRKLRLLAVCALIVAAAGPAHVHLPGPHRARVGQGPALQGVTALQRLKTDGGYTSLAAAMAAARYQIYATPGRSAQSGNSGAPFYATNPGQRLQVSFAPDEVRVSAASNQTDGKTYGAELRLRVAGFGYGDTLEPLTPGRLTTHGNRIEIAKSAIRNPQSAIEEWYENKPEGLEQGFTLSASPGRGGAGEWLRVELSVGEEWRVSLRGDQKGALFERQADGLRLSYDNLLAYDARGRALPTRMALEAVSPGGSLELLVDDARAVYPLTIDPILTRQQKLVATDPVERGNGPSLSQFGASVALSGDTAVVGVSNDNIGGRVSQGSAYVFTRSGGAWTLQQKLIAVDGAANDFFGVSVAISGDTVAVGAMGSDIGNKADQGSAYVFTRSGTAWTQQQKLTANDGAAGDQFGASVALNGDTVVAGALTDAISANADQGSVYVFTRSGTAWSQQQKLTGNDSAAGDRFGVSVALSGDTVAVGALFDDAGANFDQGSAYIFTRSGAVWTQQQKLTANDGAADDQFGYSVSISGDTVVVGAILDNIGTNASQGSAYVFTRSGGVWTQQQKLVAVDGAAGDFFGFSVAVSGDTVVIGAEGDAIGANSGQGSAYVFARSFSPGGAVWTQQQKLIAVDGAANDNFGRSVTLSGDTVVVGAPNDMGQGAAFVFVIRANNLIQQQLLAASDGAADDTFGFSVAISGDTAVMGSVADTIGTNQAQGSAYVFTRSGGVWTQQQRLTANDGVAGDLFGISVAISGDTVVVGAEFDDIGANQDQGSAYVFTRNGGVWTQQQKLMSTDGLFRQNFGVSVAISGDTVVVGAYGDDTAATGAQGVAYVFTRNKSVWTQQQKLFPKNGPPFGGFGFSCAISGDTLVVGEPFDDIGTNGNQGSAYVFTRNGVVWTQQQKLIANDGAIGDTFGISVALSGDTVVVGSLLDDIGANADQGSAYIFVRNGAVWTQQQKLTANDGAADDEFGRSVGLSGDTVVVGAPNDDIGKNEDQGSAYVFSRSGAVWMQQQKLMAGDGAAGDNFGVTVAFSGDTAMVGAPNHDIGARENQGSAYVFIFPTCPTITLDPASLPGAIVGASYNQTVTAAGGSGPYQFSLSEGALPPGLSLAQNGLLSGTPSKAGAYRFTITATILSSLCPGSRSYTLIVSIASCPTLTLNPGGLPAGRSGAAYSQQLSGSGGAAPYSFALSAGALPNGMSLSAAGLLSGPPTAFGVFNFTVRATDANGCQGARDYSLTITPPCATITVNPNALPGGAVGVAYSQTFTASGGATPYTFALSAGALPTDLSLAANGALSGPPSVAGSFNFTVRATDANGCQGTRAYTLTIPSAACNFSVAPASYAFPPDGGSGLVNVNAAGDCAWTAASNDPFITITSGANGSGNGTVKFEVSINPNPGSRRGTLNIAGRNVTVVQSAPVACVSAASFAVGGLAAESIVAGFGLGLAASTEVATTQPLPTTLAGTRVSVLDSQGTERLGALFFVSPTQINFQIPPGVAVGKALVTILREEEPVAAGEVQINPVGPGLFSADASGRGVMNGLAVRVKADGTQSLEPVLRFDEEKKQFVAAAIDLGPATEQVFLVVFGTGLRNRSGLGAVSVKIGGVSMEALYAGPQGAFAGLDQLNVLLPRSLAGRGEVELSVTVDGRQANVVKAAIQ